jgi:hypothetical protein
VLIVSQDRMEVELDLKGDDSWKSLVLEGGGAELAIPAFGFRCLVAALYEKTPLRPASQRRP